MIKVQQENCGIINMCFYILPILIARKLLILRYFRQNRFLLLTSKLVIQKIFQNPFNLNFTMFNFYNRFYFVKIIRGLLYPLFILQYSSLNIGTIKRRIKISNIKAVINEQLLLNNNLDTFALKKNLFEIDERICRTM